MPTSAEVKISIAAMADAPFILGLQKLAFQGEAQLYGDPNIPPLVQTVEEVEWEIKNQVFLKAITENRLVGSVRGFAEKGTGYVNRLIVHPAFQRRGIGTMLMAEIEARLAEATRFELFTGDRSEQNIRLYQKMGYRIFKKRRISSKVQFVYMEKRRV